MPQKDTDSPSIPSTSKVTRLVTRIYKAGFPLSKKKSFWGLRWVTSWTGLVIVVLTFSLVGTGTTLLLRNSSTIAGAATPIVNAVASKFLGTSGGNGQSVAVLETCNNGKTQQWTLLSDGTIRNNGYCLDVKYSGTTLRTPVWLYPCNGSVAQQWKLSASGEIVNPHSNLCLDDSYSSSSDGNTIWIWTCNHTDAQKWTPLKTIVLTIMPKPTVNPASTLNLSPLPTASLTPSPPQGGQTSVDPSGQPAPVGNLAGWKQLFVDDFTTDVPLGAFSDCDHNSGTPQAYCGGLKAYGSYYNNWWAYPTGWYDTAKTGADGNGGAPFGGAYHPEDTVSISGGAMHIRLYRPLSGGDNHSAAVIPLACSDQEYGRYTERFKIVQADPGFKSAHLFYQDGYEIDFPENDYGSTISAFTHPSGDNFPTDAAWTTWHTSVIEWTASSVKFYLDGTLIGTTTQSVPHIKMAWILQNESSIAGPYARPGASAQLDIDWVSCYAPA